MRDIATVVLAALLGLAAPAVDPARAQDTAESRSGDDTEIAPELAPFEHLVGGWKGMAIPPANRLKGWPERHLWSWTFEEGRPVALKLALEGNKRFASAALRYDPAARGYVLSATDVGGRPAAFRGVVDPRGQVLTLEREATDSKDRERLTLRLNSNGIRYTWIEETKEAGSPQFKRTLEANLGKEGESFAAGSDEGDLPKCILTGGAATMSVSYQGRTFPVCCTGCRDEFLADPERWIRKASQRARAAGQPAPGGAAMPEPAAPHEAAPPAPKPEGPPAAAPKAEATSSARTLLRLAQSLEKSGKSAAALSYYRRIVAEAPGTAEAKTAAGRIRAIEAMPPKP